MANEQKTKFGDIEEYVFWLWYTQNSISFSTVKFHWFKNIVETNKFFDTAVKNGLLYLDLSHKFKKVYLPCNPRKVLEFCDEKVLSGKWYFDDGGGKSKPREFNAKSSPELAKHLLFIMLEKDKVLSLEDGRKYYNGMDERQTKIFVKTVSEMIRDGLLSYEPGKWVKIASKGREKLFEMMKKKNWAWEMLNKT